MLAFEFTEHKSVKGKRLCRKDLFVINTALYAAFIVATGALNLHAQQATSQEATTKAENAEVTTKAETTLETRLAHARTLAASGNYLAAINELESVRSAAKDDSIRDVTCVLLINIHLRQNNYVRAKELLDEAFNARSQGNRSASYFALSGQALKGVRLRLEHYREFGINIAAENLPSEARNDLDHLRLLSERLVEQAKALHRENPRSMDASALLEESASMRTTLARNDEERNQWQREISEARQGLAASGAHLAASKLMTANRNSPAGTPAAAATAPANSIERKPETASTAQAPTTKTNSTPTIVTTNAQTASPSTASTSDVSKSATSTEKTKTQTPPASQPQARSATSHLPEETKNRPKAGEPVVIGSLHDKATKRVSPEYPTTAKSARIGGPVTVFLVVDEKGAVERIERMSGPAMLQQAAAEAARRWKFRPTEVNGQQVRVTGYVTFNFAL